MTNLLFSLSLSSSFNAFLANVPILNPLKTPENLWFSGVFRGYKMGTFARNGLIKNSALNDFLKCCPKEQGTLYIHTETNMLFHTYI